MNALNGYKKESQQTIDGNYLYGKVSKSGNVHVSLVYVWNTWMIHETIF